MKTNNKCAAVRLEKSKLVAALAILAVAFVVIAAVPAVVDDSDAGTEVKVTVDPSITATDSVKNTIADALNVTGVTTIVLAGNITEDVSITSGKVITLDLAGYKLTNRANHTITNDGTLTIVDSSEDKTGTIDNITHAKATILNNGITHSGWLFRYSEW